MQAPLRSDDGHSSDTAQFDLDAGTAVADLIRTTLGPNGMDKMVVERDGSVLVTNTGSSVLDRLEIEHPIGRLVTATAESQNLAVSDGSTTAVILVGELLERARDLFDDGLHPTTVIEGYATATDYARDCLTEHTIPVNPTDVDVLEQIVATTITGRWDAAATSRFADLTVSALRSTDFNIGNLTLHGYPGDECRASEVVDGILVDTDASSTSLEATAINPHRTIQSPQIALVRSEITLEDGTGPTSVTVEDPSDLDAVQTYERDASHGLVDAVRQSGADVLVCQQSIDDTLRTALTRAGVRTVERARQDEFDAIARATDAQPVLSPHELTSGTLGHAGALRHREIGQTNTIILKDCPEETHASVVLRGGTTHVVDEMRRIVGDAIDVLLHALRDGTVVPGGGATALALSRATASRANEASDRTQIVIDEYADALTAIPRTLAENAGRNPVDTLTELHTRQATEGPRIGIDASGSLRDTYAAGVLDPTPVARTVLLNALEMTTTILRTDDILPAHTPSTDTHTHEPTQADPVSDHSGYPWAIGH